MTPFSDFSALKDLKDLRDRVPGASFGLMETMVLALLVGKMIIEIHIYIYIYI